MAKEDVIVTLLIGILSLACATPAASQERARPRLKDPDCYRNINLPPEADARSPCTVRFAVRPDGTTESFEVLDLGKVDATVVDALRARVESCQYEPGLDPQGRPVRTWVLVPFRYCR
jgi:hypothetical protein